MQFTIRDYIREISSYYGEKDVYQNFGSNCDEYTLIKEFEMPVIQQMPISIIQTLLASNSYIRATEETSFKIHKGYPSPRSLYPLQLFFSLGEGIFLKNNEVDTTQNYFKNENVIIEPGSLILEVENKYPEYYSHIRKTLSTLEMGHLLYNILYIANLLGINYSLNIAENRILLINPQSITTTDNINYSRLEKFNQSCQLRSSGPYRFRILNTSINYNGSPQKLTRNLNNICTNMYRFFQLESENSIQALVYHNDGSGKFVCENQSYSDLSYQKVNKIYPHINFYGVSFFVFFLLDHTVFTDENITGHLLMLGYLAQFVCLQFLGEDKFCRPIKSFDMNTVESILGIDGAQYTSYYLLVAGKVD